MQQAPIEKLGWGLKKEKYADTKLKITVFCHLGSHSLLVIYMHFFIAIQTYTEYTSTPYYQEEKLCSIYSSRISLD